MRPGRELLADLFKYGIMAALSKSIGLLLLPALTRAFSPAEYGIIGTFLVLSTFLGFLIPLGLPSSVMRYTQRARASKEQHVLHASAMLPPFILGCGIIFVAWLVQGPAAHALTGRADLGPLLLSSIVAAVLNSWARIPETILRMRRRVITFNLIAISRALIYGSIAVSTIFLLGMGIEAVFLGQLIGAGVALVFALACVHQDVGGTPDRKWLRTTLQYGIPLVPAVAITWLNTQVDRLIILSYLGLDGVGIFSATAQIAMVAMLAATIFRQAFQPIAMGLIEGDRDTRDSFYRQTARFYSLGSASVVLVLVGLSPELFDLIAPGPFTAGIVILPWLLIGQFLHASMALTSLGVAVAEKTKFNVYGGLASGIANIGLALLLIPLLGIRGAAIGFVVGEFIYTGYMYSLSRKWYGGYLDERLHVTLLVAVILLCIGLLWLMSSTPVWSTGTLLRATGAILGAGACAALLFKREDWKALARTLQRFRRDP